MDIPLTALSSDLTGLGLCSGDRVLVHSSFRALGVSDPELLIRALLQVIGPRGTLLTPALSWTQNPSTVHDTRNTPSCIGFFAEYVRLRPGTRRSLHPTHSVCAIGADTGDLLDMHAEDTTPCGQHSPFNKLMQAGGKIVMLGCGLRPNTTMHAIEEYVRPPYLFGEEAEYTITDRNGRTFVKRYVMHGFAGVEQRYERVAPFLGPRGLVSGRVGNAESHVIAAPELLTVALAALRLDPFAFVLQEHELPLALG